MTATDTSTTTPDDPRAHAEHLSFDKTIDRGLVHRRALSEVFVTDTILTTDHHYLAGAQLPRTHPYYGDHLAQPALHDPMLLLEACRQASLAAAHLHFGVPRTNKFVLGSQDIRVLEPRLTAVTEHPCELAMDVTISDSQESSGTLTGLTHDFTLTVDGEHLGSASMSLRYLTEDGYQALRSKNRRGEPLPTSLGFVQPEVGNAPEPADAGRHTANNVILMGFTMSPDGAVAELRVPADHPSMFDHPEDHVPGMVLAEAGRQLALASAAEHLGLPREKTFVSEISCDFARFGEIDRPTSLSSTIRQNESVGGDLARHGKVDVTVEQNGRSVAELRFGVRTHDIPGSPT